MADILERKIPYLFPGDLELRLDAQNFVTAISGYPVGGGGGTIVESDFIWKPVINQDGTIGWVRDTSATTPATANLVPHIYNNYWYIGTSNTNVEARGPQGEQGEQGIQGETGPAGADGSNGTDGKTPELRINPSNAEWQWKYTVDNDWINLGVTASGAVGPQGQSGASGASGISPTVTTAAIPGEDGTRVTFTYGPGDDSTYIDVMNGAAGASGASGESGYSPTITTATTADVQHPQGGVNVTVTDIDGNKSFNIWNGIDGQGATVNLLEGDGIQITHNGTDYTIGVSADYALKSELPDVSDMATQTWVGQQNYLTSVPSEYITESELSTTLANYMQSVLTGTGLSGDGSTTALGIDTAAAINFTNASAKSAVSAASAASAYNAQYFTSGNKVVAISTYATLTELAIDSLHADEPGYREEELDEPPLIAEYAASAYLGPNTYLGFDKFVTSGDYISGDKQYVLTSGGWQELEGGSTFTGVTTTGSISGGGVNNDTIGLLTSAENALTAVDNKVNKPDTTQTDLNNNYLIYSTLTGAGTTTGWMPLSANYYSKSEANGTFVATANIDTTTLSGDGKSVSTKLGVKTDVIATRDYVNSSFLPTSGGTVSGELIVSAATGTFDNSYIKCVNDGNGGYSRFGVGSYGGAVIKAVNGNNNVQVNVKYNANNNELIQVQKSNTDIGYLIPAVTSTTTAGLTDDGILHIILES